MSDPRDPERILDDSISRLIENAGSDTPAPPDPTRFTTRLRPTLPPRRVHPHRLVTVAAVTLVALATAGMVFVIADRDQEVAPSGNTEPRAEATTTATTQTTSESTIAVPTSTAVVQASDTAAPTTVETPVASTTGATAPTTEATAPTTDSVAVGDITRPIVDPDVCAPTSAREGHVPGVPLFLRPTTNPVPIQIIADLDLGPSGPFAAVQRIFGDGYTVGTDTIDVNGIAVKITHDYGRGEAVWDLGDGSQALLRSRGLNDDAIIDIVAHLVPRPQSASLPGFDLAPAADPVSGEQTSGLRLLHEQMSGDITGEVASSECRVVPTGLVYRISALSGDPVFRYGGLLDRPTPLDAALRNDTLVVINGAADSAAPTVADVHDADPASWLDLQARSTNPAGSPRTESLAEGAELVLPFVATEPTTPTNHVTVRLVTREGVVFLELHTDAVVLAPDSAFWMVDIDGRGGISTARVGSVHGYRIGDAPLTEPVNVTISIIDGGGFVLQSTAAVQLLL